MMVAVFVRAPRGEENLCHAGRMYRPQKNLANGHTRRKRAESERDSNAAGTQ